MAKVVWAHLRWVLCVGLELHWKEMALGWMALSQTGQTQVVLGGPGFGWTSPDKVIIAAVHARESRGQPAQKMGRWASLRRQEL